MAQTYTNKDGIKRFSKVGFNDLDIITLQVLTEYVQLPGNFVREVANQRAEKPLSEKSFANHLNQLRHYGYVGTFDRDDFPGNSLATYLVYFITPKGIKYLRDNDHYFPPYKMWGRRSNELKSRVGTRATNLVHTTGQCRSIAQLEIGINDIGGRLMSTTEIYENLPDFQKRQPLPFAAMVDYYYDETPDRKLLEPDEIAAIEYATGQKRVLFLEENLGTEAGARSGTELKSHQRECAMYHALSKGLYKEVFNVSSMLVLNVLPNTQKMKLCMKRHAEIFPHGLPFMLYQTQQRIGKMPNQKADGGLIHNLWQRVNHEPFDLGQI